jgi:uncharacterized protein
MNSDERRLISDLFERMRGYGAPDKDRDAEALISQSVRANPDAPYMLVQSVLVQEQALQAANNRVLDLEEQLRGMEESDRSRGSGSGSFLGSIWGGARRGEEPRSSVPQVGARATPSAYDSRSDNRSPWSQSAQPPQQQPAPAAASGGGFMRSALTTAAGVAGGMLLADSVRNMLGGGHAQASSAFGGGSSSDLRAQDARDDAEEDAKDVQDDNDPGTYEDDDNDPGFDSGSGEIET